MREPCTHRRTRKALVEDSRALRVARVLEALNARLPGAPALLCARRPDGSGDALEIRIEPRSGNRLRLAYINGTPCSCTISLVAVPQHFGGVRWFVECPLLDADGGPCRRRVRALYLPAGRRYFGCRWCHHLTYRSVQRPVASQLQRLAETLAYFERDLNSRDTLAQIGAIIGAKETIRSFLDSTRGC